MGGVPRRMNRSCMGTLCLPMCIHPPVVSPPQMLSPGSGVRTALPGRRRSVYCYVFARESSSPVPCGACHCSLRPMMCDARERAAVCGTRSTVVARLPTRALATHHCMHVQLFYHPASRFRCVEEAFHGRPGALAHQGACARTAFRWAAAGSNSGWCGVLFGSAVLRPAVMPPRGFRPFSHIWPRSGGWCPALP